MTIVVVVRSLLLNLWRFSLYPCGSTTSIAPPWVEKTLLPLWNLRVTARQHWTSNLDYKVPAWYLPVLSNYQEWLFFKDEYKMLLLFLNQQHVRPKTNTYTILIHRLLILTNQHVRWRYGQETDRGREWIYLRVGPKKAELLLTPVGIPAKTTCSEEYPSGTESKPVDHFGVHKETYIHTEFWVHLMLDPWGWWLDLIWFPEPHFKKVLSKISPYLWK